MTKYYQINFSVKTIIWFIIRLNTNPIGCVATITIYLYSYPISSVYPLVCINYFSPFLLSISLHFTPTLEVVTPCGLYLNQTLSLPYFLLFTQGYTILLPAQSY